MFIFGFHCGVLSLGEVCQTWVHDENIINDEAVCWSRLAPDAVKKCHLNNNFLVYHVDGHEVLWEGLNFAVAFSLGLRWVLSSGYHSAGLDNCWPLVLFVGTFSIVAVKYNLQGKGGLRFARGNTAKTPPGKDITFSRCNTTGSLNCKKYNFNI